MLSKELELSLNQAFRSAYEKRHEFISVEHLLLAMLDNLGKGASGAAVQNLNIMAGLPETAGLVL